MEMMERPLLPWRLQWTPLFFSATFFCSFLGAVNDAVQTPLHRVNGVLRRSTLLSVSNISPSEEVTRVEWDFQPQNGTGLSIAEFRDGKWERPNPKDQFGMRLELVNETTLRIRNLEKEDSGVYKARVRLHPAKIEEHCFRLTIYDPVPEPQIHLLQETPNSSSECNVTLQCLVSEKGGLNVSWKIGDALRPLEGDPDWYWFSSKGWHIHLSNPTESNVTCLVTNLADRKIASVDLTSVCPRPDGRQEHWWLIFPIAIVVVLVSGFWIWKKRRKQPRCSEEILEEPLDSAADSALEANKVPEDQYMEVQNVRDNDQGS
ncbi:uncharacterized protein LOC121915791 isoform X2 [Sceloporus undulatus]|uniref:uncharacterized protein LOC121915791 isoform X2 n=1 Tax=Sceloporus undulatus TaxID=8520 RepID=UPI001C4D45C9|nr:uncharacterized protein LOC121915791 isoform X2 [Sceloporus undulatus]